MSNNFDVKNNPCKIYLIDIQLKNGYEWIQEVNMDIGEKIKRGSYKSFLNRAATALLWKHVAVL